VAAELERAASHLGTLAALFETMGLAATAAPLADLGASVGAGLAGLAGGPEAGPLIVPGGVQRSPADERRIELRQLLTSASRRLYQIADQTIAQRLILARTVDVGVLSGAAAAQFRLRGPLARASGLKDDVRLDAPYGAYSDLAPQLITQESGDIYGRLVLLLLEALEGLKLADRALDELPDSPLMAQMPSSPRAGEGEATVEAPRGALRYRIESDGKRISSYRAEPAPQLDRLLARTILSQAAPDDAVLIALSTDPCSTCQRAGDDE
jgi:Ni,Fe-hydrogenase III large subunit